MRITINRIEGELAVCELENGQLLNVPSRLFGNISEGDVVEIKVNQALTEERKQENSAKLRSLFHKSKK